MRYIWAKFLSLAGQNALIYGLFIAVITREESSLTTSAFVLASVVPSIVLSVPGGLLADLTPNKASLLATMLLRLVLVFLFFDLGPNVEGVIGLTFLVWSVYQFFAPAESAAVLALVPRERLPHASSLVQALSLAGQLVGAGIIAPLAVHLLDENGLYVIVFLMLAASFVLFAMIPDLSAEQEREAKRLSPWRALPTGLRTIMADDTPDEAHDPPHPPRYGHARVRRHRAGVHRGHTEHRRDATPSTSPCRAPSASGWACSLSPLLLTFVQARWLALCGFVMFTAALFALPFVDVIAPKLTEPLGPFRDFQHWVNLSDSIAATMFLLPFAGLGSSFVQVAARTEVVPPLPPSVIAQVFSTQSAMASIAALVPTFLVGVLLDVLPVSVVLESVALTLASLAPGHVDREAPAGGLGRHREHHVAALRLVTCSHRRREPRGTRVNSQRKDEELAA